MIFFVQKSRRHRGARPQFALGDHGRSFASRCGEAIFTGHQTLGDAQEFYADIKVRVKSVGRNLDHVKACPASATSWSALRVGPRTVPSDTRLSFAPGHFSVPVCCRPPAEIDLAGPRSGYAQ